jgi:hypothetical protein
MSRQSYHKKRVDINIREPSMRTRVLLARISS